MGPEYPPGYEPLPIPEGLNESNWSDPSSGPASLHAAVGNVTTLDDWRDVVTECANVVWDRLPEAMDADDKTPDEDPDFAIYELRRLALRVGAVMGMALARTWPDKPEQLMDWIRAATVYAGFRIYDVPVGPWGRKEGVESAD